MADAKDWLEEAEPWEKGMFRLFLSHVTAHKEFACQLKDRLARRGIDLFVAHEDIRPSRKWADVITMALGNAHALAALLTPGFRESEWTDQEIGFALCRGIVIWPLKTDATNPHGFLGHYQALPCDLDYPDAVASSLFDELMAAPSTAPIIRRGLVARMRWSPDFTTSITISKLIRFMDGFTTSELALLAEAVEENGQVRIPHKVGDYIQEILQRHKFEPAA